MTSQINSDDSSAVNDKLLGVNIIIIDEIRTTSASD